ncbi:ABC transporter permease [Siccirubricoccus phaeus]|uniref:ABC transporter permease n=1 Tax=Siccirubricoccus phaeus TaxID=2595053 RepID=UPI0011F13FC8|nr:ABC transporter permease subunit [Siccirubricoccus phaeus]
MSAADRLRGLVLPLLLLAAWQGAVTAGYGDPRLLPPPVEVLRRAWQLLVAEDLPLALAISLGRCLAGFALGALLGLGFGLLCGLSRAADRLLGPAFHALKNVAVFAWIPLIAMWFGFGEASRIAFVTLAVLTPVALNVWEGVAGVPKPLLEVGAAFRFGGWQRLARIRLPAALPAILTGLQLGLIHAWLATVGAEYFLAKGTGLGGVLIEGRDKFDMALVLLGILLLGGIGLLLNQLLTRLAARLAPWRAA